MMADNGANEDIHAIRSSTSLPAMGPTILIDKWVARPYCLITDQDSLVERPSSQSSPFLTILNEDIRRMIYDVLVAENNTIQVRYEPPAQFIVLLQDIGGLMTTCRTALFEISQYLESAKLRFSMVPSSIIGFKFQSGVLSCDNLQSLHITLPDKATKKKTKTPAAQTLLHCLEVFPNLRYLEIEREFEGEIFMEGLRDPGPKLLVGVRVLYEGGLALQERFFTLLAVHGSGVFFDMAGCAQIIAEEVVRTPKRHRVHGPGGIVESSMRRDMPEVRFILRLGNGEHDGGLEKWRMLFNLNKCSLDWFDGENTYSFSQLWWKAAFSPFMPWSAGTANPTQAEVHPKFLKRSTWMLTRSFLDSL